MRKTSRRARTGAVSVKGRVGTVSAVSWSRRWLRVETKTARRVQRVTGAKREPMTPEWMMV